MNMGTRISNYIQTKYQTFRKAQEDNHLREKIKFTTSISGALHYSWIYLVFYLYGKGLKGEPRVISDGTHLTVVLLMHHMQSRFVPIDPTSIQTIYIAVFEANQLVIPCFFIFSTDVGPAEPYVTVGAPEVGY